MHVSQLADRFVKDPAEVVKVHQRVQVTVLEVDLARKRIGLSMKSKPPAGAMGATPTGPQDNAGRPNRAARRPAPSTAKGCHRLVHPGDEQAAQEKAQREPDENN